MFSHWFLIGIRRCVSSLLFWKPKFFHQKFSIKSFQSFIRNRLKNSLCKSNVIFAQTPTKSPEEKISNWIYFHLYGIFNQVSNLCLFVCYVNSRARRFSAVAAGMRSIQSISNQSERNLFCRGNVKPPLWFTRKKQLNGNGRNVLDCWSRKQIRRRAINWKKLFRVTMCQTLCFALTFYASLQRSRTRLEKHFCLKFNTSFES